MTDDLPARLERAMKARGTRTRAVKEQAYLSAKQRAKIEAAR